MKKFFDTIIDHFETYKWVVRIVMSLLLVVHCVLNSVYMGKPVPVTHIVLQEWMAYANVICVGILTGVVWVVTDFKIEDFKK